MPNEKSSYPFISQQTCWKLRKRFQQGLPGGKVTPNYLHSVLGITEKTARNNELPSLRRVGLVEQDGAVSERARRWRLDEHYADVCKEIKEEVYPQELLDAVPDPVADEQAAVRWFMNASHVGQQAASRMAKAYRLLSEADPAAGNELLKKPVEARLTTPKARVTKQNEDATAENFSQPQPNSQSVVPNVAPPQEQSQSFPAVHIDIQIHIAADASSAQIDQIFASMSKHLYGRSQD